MTLSTPCPILADLQDAERSFRVLLKRIRRDLKHCTACTHGNACPNRTIIEDSLRQVSRELSDDLNSHAS